MYPKPSLQWNFPEVQGTNSHHFLFLRCSSIPIQFHFLLLVTGGHAGTSLLSKWYVLEKRKGKRWETVRKDGWRERGRTVARCECYERVMFPFMWWWTANQDPKTAYPKAKHKATVCFWGLLTDGVYLWPYDNKLCTTKESQTVKHQHELY